jgi:hypothetical protein
MVVKSFRLDEDDDRDNKQRFLEEPQDVFAVVGQPEVALSCVVLGKRGRQSWKTRHLHTMAASELVAMDPRQTDKIRVTLDKYSLADYHRLASGKASASQQQKQQKQQSPDAQTGATSAPSSADREAELAALDDDAIVSNYTIHIRDVALINDDYYRCQVSHADKSHRFIESRQARLNVLQPPGQLELRLAAILSANGTETDYSGMDPGDTPLAIIDHQQVSERRRAST